MDIFKPIQEFFDSVSYQIPLVGFIINLMLASLLSLALSRIYVKYGNSLSNRREFGKNFMLITMTTVLIITIVKSSLALSLGLVGALSIIRFRAAIKEPEELAFLFLTIGIGLGFGADQGVATIAAFILISTMVILVKQFAHEAKNDQNLYLTISSNEPHVIKLKEIIEVLDKYCLAVNMRRFDKKSDLLEASFMVEFGDFDKLIHAERELRKLDNALTITFLDDSRLF